MVFSEAEGEMRDKEAPPAYRTNQQVGTSCSLKDLSLSGVLTGLVLRKSRGSLEPGVGIREPRSTRNSIMAPCNKSLLSGGRRVDSMTRL